MAPGFPSSTLLPFFFLEYPLPFIFYGDSLLTPKSRTKGTLSYHEGATGELNLSPYYEGASGERNSKPYKP